MTPFSLAAIIGTVFMLAVGQVLFKFAANGIDIAQKGFVGAVLLNKWLIVALVVQHGVQYLLATVLLSGLIMLAFGLLKLGKLVRMVPHPVMLGFVNGLAIVIAMAQLAQRYAAVRDDRPGGADHGYCLFVAAPDPRRAACVGCDLERGAGGVLFGSADPYPR